MAQHNRMILCLFLCLSCQIICRLQLTPAEWSDPDLFCDYRYIQRKTGGYNATRFSSILLLKSLGACLCVGSIPTPGTK